MTSDTEATLPAIHAHHLTELVQRWHVEADELLEGTGVTPDELTDPDGRLSIAFYKNLIKRARSLTGEPGLGIYFGLDMRITSHGLLGFAALTAANVGEALDLACRYAPTRTTALELRTAVGETTAALILEERADLGEARDAILFALTMGVWQIANVVTGKALEGRAEFTFDEPNYAHRFEHLVPGSLTFGCAQNKIIFERSYLDLPMSMSDPVALHVAREQCERELQALGFGADVVARLRKVLPRSEGAGYLSLEESARALHMSERTLKRRLAASGTSFSSVLDELRTETSMLLLRSGKLSMADIAERMGYADASAFSKAFRRWTGVSPAMFQRSGKPED